MGISLRDAGNALRNLKAIGVRDAGNILRAPRVMKARDAGNVLRTVWQSMTAAASPASVAGYASSSSVTPISTSPASATPTGGAAPFTYSWEAVSALGWTINAPASDATSFTSPAIDPGSGEVGTFKCTVTDAAGAVAETNEVTASVTNIGGYSGEFIP